ncbi:Thymidylate kinase [Candidatus Filomicrobium marinum]|uniref:Thymidylate kinase n=2 Tax=Filomicrobium TaxID=119044 RepID=A0A0D6JJ34_9HYPH|nr:Thymidylate kinase [Candidatus Filomicrobium marinum]CPR21693.1 Thymidylate kinase [Candidatus Filomicrobium marinum]
MRAYEGAPDGAMTTGKLITFEGGEGSGKSTQARQLAERLGAANISTIVTREPGGAPLAEKIRDLVLSDRPAAAVTELLLFAAARAEHIAVTIAPALGAGTWVVCDRYIDSSRVYQGDIGGIDKAFIRAIEQQTVTPWFPDLTLVLDVGAKVGMERAQARGGLTRFDAASLAQHEQVRQGFLDLAMAEKDRCVVLNGAEPEAEVAEAVWKAVTERLIATAG